MKQNNSKANKDNIPLIIDKTPPQDSKIESDVLGSMLYTSSTISKAIAILKPSDFYSISNQIICKTIFDLYERNIVPDLPLIFAEIKANSLMDDIGGIHTLTSLKAGVTSDANMDYKCRLIKQKSVTRDLIEFSTSVLSEAFDEGTDVFDLLNLAGDKLKKINFELDETKVTKIENVAMNVVKDFSNKVYNAQNGIIDENSIKTGFREWDKINGDLFAGLYIVAGRPGMGKGVHLTETVCRMAVDTNVGIINGEMTDEQLLKRIGCNLMGIDNYIFKKDAKMVTKDEQDKLQDAMEAAIQLKIHIEGSRRIDKISSRIKLWVEKYDVKCVFADFLTLFTVPPEKERYMTDTQKVNYILMEFTELCKVLKIPIILYVQMNREILGRAGAKEPNLGDLKQSGSIEELAFQVSVLHRPEYYDKDAISDDMGEDIRGLMYQIILKHRDGQVGRLKYRTNLACSQMKDWDEGNTLTPKEMLDTPF